MATTIQEYAAAIDVKQLVHFTRESSLDSIMQRGLITRNTLVLEGFTAFNDNVRADYTHAVCVSIGLSWSLSLAHYGNCFGHTVRDHDWLLCGSLMYGMPQ